jgi:multiple sugar transport system permease protein
MLRAAARSYASALLLLLFVAFPLYWMALTSLKPQTEVFRVPPTWVPAAPTVEHYVNLFRLTDFGLLFVNSLQVCLLSTAMALAVGILGAYALARFRFRGKEAYGRLVLLAYMFPGALLVIPLLLLFRRLGLTNSHLGLSLAYLTFALPFCLWVMRDFFASVPVDLEEAALIDGATRLGALWDVVLPQAVPGIIATGIFAFLFAWNEYLFALILVSDESLRTLPPGMMRFVSATDTNWGLIMAASTLATLPMALAFGLVQRYLVTGMGAGGVKG